MTTQPVNKRRFSDRLIALLPQAGSAGSRSSVLHSSELAPQAAPLNPREQQRFFLLRLIGLLGAFMIGAGALGAGALPVTGNPYRNLPLGGVFTQMLPTATAVVLIGVALMVVAWGLMAPFTGARVLPGKISPRRVTTQQVVTTAIAWITPIALTAPMFTQDIYSYLAQGKIVALGIDPYVGGPVDLLGVADPLARSVPFIWSHSPSPYGPVALGIASVFFRIAGDSIIAGVLLHRLASVLGVAAGAWAIARLARRCGVTVTAALWLAVLNPLAILHLIGGIHNESVQMGFALVGMELSLGGIALISGTLGQAGRRRGWILFTIGGMLIVCAGLVKVTGFVPLGFTGIALARALYRRNHPEEHAPTIRLAWKQIVLAVVFQVAVLVGTIALATVITGIGLGWVTGQGGAATVRSWLSLTTTIGVISGWVGQAAGLGDLTDPALVFTRAIGVLVAMVFAVRMLYATLRGAIHPVGGWGVAMIVLVILFPVVHPWYILWALLPLAAWANRPSFVGWSALLCGFVSLIVLPRGLTLPVTTVSTIYLTALLGFLTLAFLLFWASRSPKLIHALHWVR